MRTFLSVIFIFYTVTCVGQAPKTIPGVFVYDFYTPENYVVSNSGTSIAMKRGSYLYVLFDVKSGTVKQLEKNLASISSDHRYLFTSTSNGTFNQGTGWRYAWELRSAGIASDTALKRIVSDHLAIDMDEKGNYIATNIWYDSTESYLLKGMKGLYKLDRTTGKVVQALREDTLFICRDWKGCSPAATYLQKKYLAVSAKTYGEGITIYPLDGSPKINVPAHNYHTVMADSLVLFTIGDSTIDYRKITAFDVRTGQQLSQKTIPRSSYYGQTFSVAGNKLYILQLVWNKIEEYTPTKEGFVVSKTWDIKPTLNLAQEQNWRIFAIKGPSFFVAPSVMTKGEAGGESANTAHLINGNTNKIALQVYPFYNRTPDDVAKQAKDKEATDKFLAKVQAEKDSIAHPERYCHLYWNTKDWRKGLTIAWGGGYYILADYDCKNDKYKLWRPAQLYNGNGHYMEPQYVMVSGSEYRSGGSYYSRLQYVTCTECDGDGTYEVTTYTTKTKDLPWGYFSGIETKKITTTSTTTKRTCSKCMGNGIVLK